MHEYEKLVRLSSSSHDDKNTFTIVTDSWSHGHGMDDAVPAVPSDRGWIVGFPGEERSIILSAFYSFGAYGQLARSFDLPPFLHVISLSSKCQGQ